MNNYDEFKQLLVMYARNKPGRVCIADFESTLHDTSKDDTNSVYVYNSPNNLGVISPDAYARIYAQIHYTGAAKIQNSDSPASCDALLIDKNNKWFFIEFKDQPIDADKVRKDVPKKVYQNYYWLLDVLYDMRSSNIYSGKSQVVSDPVAFARNNIEFILVVSKSKNPVATKKTIRYRRARKEYKPPFLQKIKDYLFHDAMFYNEEEFERTFVKKFDYQ